MGILEFLGLKEKDPLEDEYRGWKARMDAERESRATPSEGLTPREKRLSKIHAKWINPCFGGPYSRKRLPIAGGKLVDVDRIADVPWPDDIHIDPITFTRSETGEEANYISMAADGPNGDGTMHHGSMEYLPDYPDRETMLRSAADIAELVYRITGHKPCMCLTSEDRNEHAKWSMGERENPPEGYGYDKFRKEFGGPECSTPPSRNP